MADVQQEFPLKVYADYLIMGVLVGPVSREDVIHWSDGLIRESETAEDWMIDISLSIHLHPLDIIHLLGKIPGTRDYEQSFRLLLRQLACEKPTVELQDKPLIKHLFQLRRWEISNIFKNPILTMEFDLDCFEEGYGDWSIIKKDYLDLLPLG